MSVVDVVRSIGCKGTSVSLYDLCSLQCNDEVLDMPEDMSLIVVPGDNDIGGEGVDGMNEEVNR